MPVSRVAGRSAKMANGETHKHTHLHGDMHLAVHYPLPGGLDEALPNLGRAMANQLGG
jgi:hypothetical protein